MVLKKGKYEITAERISRVTLLRHQQPELARVGCAGKRINWVFLKAIVIPETQIICVAQNKPPFISFLTKLYFASHPAMSREK